LTIRTNGSTGIVVGTYSGATAYQVAIVLRGTGAWYFIKGGAFTNWTMIWVSATNNSAGIPAAAASSGVTVTTFDNMRVPDATVTTQRYISLPLAYDTFTRADGALGSTETVGPDSQTAPALAWTLQQGTIVIATNKASLTVLAGGDGIVTVSAASADIVIDVAAVRTLTNCGVVLRYVDTSNYIIAYTDGTNAKLDKVVAGSTTNVLTGAVTYGAGNVLRVIADGTGFRLYYNNLAVGALGTIADAGLQSSTLCGLYGTDLTATWDNFTVWARGNTGTQHAALDAF
jgi:hypothetical protein